MKFSCSTSDFLQALQLVSRAIGTQQALPILGNILLEASGTTCTVSATDLELSIVTSFDATIEREGSLTVPAKAILNFAQYNSDSDVVLDVHEGTQLKCTSKHAKTVIAGEASTEYPTITPIDRQISFSLEATPLLRALHLVTFASAKTTLRPVLSGVYVRRDGEFLILVATDSYRLSEYKLKIAGEATDISCIIPAKILEELKLVLGGKRGEKKEEVKEGEMQEVPRVSITLSRQQIEVQAGRTRFLSRLIDGKFPNYEQIIPKDIVTTVHLPSRELLTVVKRMHYFAKEMNNNLTFHCDKTEVRLQTPQTQIGRDEATISGEVTGDANKIALSSSYLLDFLNHVDAESIAMRMSDSLHPAVFALADEATFLHLIMPLRMQDE